MKVQIISNLFPLPWEPNRAAFNRQQFEYLAKRCDLRILVVVPWLLCLKNTKKLKSSIANNITVEYVWYFFTPKIARVLYPLFLFLSLLIKIPSIRKCKPDCLLLSWAYPDAVAGVLIGKLLNIPAVIKIHGSDINGHTLHPVRARQIVWAMKKAKAVISVSKALATKLVELGVPEQKIHVIYNGVDKDVFFPQSEALCKNALKLEPTNKHILYIGNILKSKGCEDLLNAFAIFARTDVTTCLYYAGPGKYTNTLKKLADSLGLTDRVFFLGAVKHSQLPTWINACNLVVLPSYNEGVPNVLLEAKACGKPVLATKVGGIPEIINVDTGVLIECGDITALAEGLIACLAKDWSLKALTESVRNMTWDMNVEQVESVLKQVIEDSGKNNRPRVEIAK